MAEPKHQDPGAMSSAELERASIILRQKMQDPAITAEEREQLLTRLRPFEEEEEFFVAHSLAALASAGNLTVVTLMLK